MSDLRRSGDTWVTAADGRRYWGVYGAAGLLAFDPSRGVLLQHRAGWSDQGNTWGIPGGARLENEDAVSAALRESMEEAAVPEHAVVPKFSHTLDRVGWTYTTVIAEVIEPFEAKISDAESHALRWVLIEDVATYPLHPGFAEAWPLLKRVLENHPRDTAELLSSGAVTAF